MKIKPNGLQRYLAFKDNHPTVFQNPLNDRWWVRNSRSYANFIEGYYAVPQLDDFVFIVRMLNKTLDES